MSDVYGYEAGDKPLLVSVPHDGREIPPDIQARMTAAGRAIPDTDWHVAKLYDFATELGASVVTANYSRYVIDLNRSANDVSLYPGQVVTGLCPEETFDGATIYSAGGVDVKEKDDRTERFWHPYHQRIRDTLTAMREQFGYALLWDAHSIPSNVPRLFDGELPALNLGSNSSASCSDSVESAVTDVLSMSGYSKAINGRFKGGYITRHYGDPENGCHALQMEIAQRAYMDELSGEFDNAKAAKLRVTLSELLRTYLSTAEI